MKIIEELSSQSVTAFSLSANVEDFGKLSPKNVYDKILSGDFLISHPEKTKTTRACVAQC